jgi:hypothetical protein
VRLPISLQGAVAGRVWLDSDANNVVTIGIDEGFEGIVVNLFRIVGSRRTYLGCTQTDGTGELVDQITCICIECIYVCTTYMSALDMACQMCVGLCLQAVHQWQMRSSIWHVADHPGMS